MFVIAPFLPDNAVVGTIGGIITYVFLAMVNMNIMLAVFNLLPIPPLDGSKIFALLLPEKEAHTYLSIGSVGMILLIVLLNFPLGGFSLSSFLGTLFTTARGWLLYAS
jgi:Zn-dependent protease